MGQQTRIVFARGGIGWIAFIIWCIFFGATMAIPGFAISGTILGIWLIIAALLMAFGV